MRGIKNRGENKWKKWAAFVALFLLFAVLLNSTRKVYNKKVEAQKLLTQMQEEFKTMENRQKVLADSLQKLSTTEGMTFEMRQKLNVAQVGEGVAIIVDEKQATSTPPAQISNWQKIKGFWTELFR
jgi:hypothetical protein